MGYIGKIPATQGKDAGPSLKLDDISSNFDGNTTVFDLAVNGTAVDPHINNIQIYLSGVHQLPGTSYSLSGSQVVFTGAPSSSPRSAGRGHRRNQSGNRSWQMP